MIIDWFDFKRVSFSGEWKDDEKVSGIIIYRDGVKEKYEGQLFNDQPHGKGVTTFVDGAVY